MLDPLKIRTFWSEGAIALIIQKHTCAFSVITELDEKNLYNVHAIFIKFEVLQDSCY